MQKFGNFFLASNSLTTNLYKYNSLSEQIHWAKSARLSSPLFFIALMPLPLQIYLCILYHHTPILLVLLLAKVIYISLTFVNSRKEKGDLSHKLVTVTLSSNCKEILEAFNIMIFAFSTARSQWDKESYTGKGKTILENTWKFAKMIFICVYLFRENSWGENSSM